MKISTKQYVQALFSISQKKNHLDDIIEQMKGLSINLIPLKDFLENPNQDERKKRGTLKSWKINYLLINFLLLLNKNKDLSRMGSILSALKELRNSKSKTIEAKIETAEELLEEEKKKILSFLKKKLAKRVVLETDINPDLIGGIVLKIGDKLIDNSLKNRMDILKNTLLG